MSGAIDLGQYRPGKHLPMAIPPRPARSSNWPGCCRPGPWPRTTPGWLVRNSRPRAIAVAAHGVQHQPQPRGPIEARLRAAEKRAEQAADPQAQGDPRSWRLLLGLGHGQFDEQLARASGTSRTLKWNGPQRHSSPGSGSRSSTSWMTPAKRDAIGSPAVRSGNDGPGAARWSCP